MSSVTQYRRRLRRQGVWIAYADMLVGLLFCFIAVTIITYRSYNEARQGRCEVVGRVVDGSGNGLADVKVSATERGSGEGLSTSTSRRGEYRFTKIGRSAVCEFTYAKEGYITTTTVHQVAAGERDTLSDVTLKPKPPAAGLDLLPVCADTLFASGRSELLNKEELLATVTAYEVEPGVTLRDWLDQDRDRFVWVEGFADVVQQRGDPFYNLGLSARRAQSVAEALIVELGYPSDRVIVVGYGEYHPCPPADVDDGTWRTVLKEAGSGAGTPDGWLGSMQRAMAQRNLEPSWPRPGGADNEWLQNNRRILIRPAVGYREKIEGIVSSSSARLPANPGR